MKNKKQQFSELHYKFIRKLRIQTVVVHTIRILLLVGFLGIWELATATGALDPFIASSPSRVVTTFVDLIKNSNLLHHSWVTLYETILAFLISTGIGLALAIVLYMIPFVRRILEPYLVVLNSLPKIALGPLIIVWMGAGTKTIVAMGVLICVIITTINMLHGFCQIEDDKIMLMKTMGANKIQTFTRLVFPANIPSLISSLKINVGMAWVGVIMGEYLTSKAGLGYLIVYGGQVFKLDLVMTSIVVLCILAGLMYGIIALAEIYVNKKR
ncbi:MAG: ABC transporter permease [Clostridia bacterium]|nr:ABC transporter permease [Clostridia bacterium]